MPYTLTTRDGRIYNLPIGPSGASFAGMPDCPYCNGHAKEDGTYAGGMRPIRVIRGELYPHDRWFPCGRCAFGAARRKVFGGRFWEDHPDALEDPNGPAFPHGNRTKLPPPEAMARIQVMLKALYAKCHLAYQPMPTWEAPPSDPVQPEDQGEPVPECLL
jgi:hypothetical protein